MDTLQFTNFIRNSGISLAKQKLIINKYIELQRNSEINKKFTTTTTEQYCKQIISMIKNNPNLPNDTYISYIKFVMEKVFEAENSTKK